MALRVALAPRGGALILNLSQLLFITGNYDEAHRLLNLSIHSGIEKSAHLEARFYFLSHTSTVPRTIFQKVKRLLELGARLHWDVVPNIEYVRESDKNKAELLTSISEIMAGERKVELLDEIICKWM